MPPISGQWPMLDSQQNSRPARLRLGQVDQPGQRQADHGGGKHDPKSAQFHAAILSISFGFIREIASYFSFKILRGADQSIVSIFCESNGIKTPLSIPITVKNELSEIRYLSDISGNYEVAFNTDLEGAIVVTPVYIGDFEIFLTNKIYTYFDHNIIV